MFIDLHVGTLHEPLANRRLDSRQAHERIRHRALLMRRVGVERGHRIFLHYGNKPEFFIDLAALWQLGACAVPVDPRFTAFEVEQLALAIRPTCAIWEAEPPAAIASVLKQYQVHCLSANETSASVDRDVQFSGLPQLDDDALILFTSGTTGQPKGVVHTHRSLRARWNHQRERLGVTPFARTLCAVPTHFAWGLIGHCLYAWLSGQDLYLLPAFRQDMLLRLGALCDELAITCLPSVPTMWKVALKTARPPTRNTLERVTCGTGPLSPELWRGIGTWSGNAEVVNVYGITETGWLAGATQHQLEGDESLVGEAWGAVIRVLEHASTDIPVHQWRGCAPGDVGHIWVQTSSLMKGYFGRDDLTRQVISQGWFSTGDLGSIDDRGRLYLRGRDKDMINVGGAKVYPGDIDAALQGLDDVDDVCAFGFDDALQGENVAVAVVLKNRSEHGLVRLYAQAAERLAQHQLPRRWYLLDQIPRTARGKLNRSAVASACAAQTPTDQRVLERQRQAGAA